MLLGPRVLSDEEGGYIGGHVVQRSKQKPRAEEGGGWKGVGGRWLEKEPGSEGLPSLQFGPEVGSLGFPESTHNLAANFCPASVFPSICLDCGVEKNLSRQIGYLTLICHRQGKQAGRVRDFTFIRLNVCQTPYQSLCLHYFSGFSQSPYEMA